MLSRCDRSLLDQPDQSRLEHRLQNHLHRQPILHRLPHARRLQTHTRSEPGHVQSGVPATGGHGTGARVAAGIPGLGGTYQEDQVQGTEKLHTAGC